MTAKQNDDDRGVLDWEQLSRPDQIRAEELLHELNALFNKYENVDHQEPVDKDVEAS